MSQNLEGRHRRSHTHEINRGWLNYGEYHTLFQTMKNHPDRFKNYARMELSTFNHILEKIEPRLKKRWCNLHPRPIRHLGEGSSPASLAYTFRMGESTVRAILRETLTAIWNELYETYMPVPSKEDLLKNAEDFYNIWNLPHCMGAIDVRHIDIKRPANSGTSFYKYKKFYSITLQAVVDAKYRFICIDVGGYGHQHVSTTFYFSQFYRAIKAGIIKIPEDNELPHSDIVLPYFFVGDGAYPLMQHLMKPYPGRRLPENKVKYNKRLSRGRLVSECAFGKTVQKWQIFYKALQCTSEMAELITKVTCLLHNIIIELEGHGNQLAQPTISVPTTCKSFAKITVENEEIEDYFPVGNGSQVREKLKSFILQHPIYY